MLGTIVRRTQAFHDRPAFARPVGAPLRFAQGRSLHVPLIAPSGDDDVVDRHVADDPVRLAALVLKRRDVTPARVEARELNDDLGIAGPEDAPAEATCRWGLRP